MKFSKKEISLCKQVAEKHRKELVYGDLFYFIEDKNYYLWMHSQARIDVPELWFPLWTISDCLEFLRERDWLIELKNSATPRYGKYYCACFMPREHPNRKHGIYKYGNTTLETLLKVILGVLGKVVE